MSGAGRDEKRSPAEWVTFAVAVAVILVVVGLIVVKIPQDRRPPAPVARHGRPVERGARFVVPVSVENLGDRTARDVQVRAVLRIDDEEHEGEQLVDFLSGGETEEIEFVFDDDPGDGDLDVRVTGYSLP